MTVEIRSTNFIVEPEDVTAQGLILRGAEARHLAKVMRASRGDLFCAVDGTGKKYYAAIAKISREEVHADIVKVTRNENESIIDIAMGIPLLKSSVMDYAIEKATECGVSSFIPFVSENSAAAMPEGMKLNRKLNRWRGVIRAAVKQSLRSRIPRLGYPVAITELLNLSGDYSIKLLADPGQGSIALSEIAIPSGNCRVLAVVGPEAGFTVAEIADAREAGFNIVHFGTRRLRSETATAVVPFLLQYIAGDLN
jgi:16S rRNA (uracil1498-N3)-methyltransferase